MEVRRLLALIAASVMIAAPASAQDADWSVTIVGEHQTPTNNPPAPGETESFGQHYDVPPELVGQACSVVVHTINNESVHDTDFYIDTDTRVLVVEDIEDGAGKAVDALGTIDPMPASLVMGFTLGHYNRGMWRTSITVQVVFDCQEQPSTTTTSPTSTVPATSSTTATSTSIPATTSTAPTTTTTPAPSPTPPVVVDTWPELVTTSTPDTSPSTLPEELPHTGAGFTTMALAAFGLLATGSYTAWRFRER